MGRAAVGRGWDAERGRDGEANAGEQGAQMGAESADGEELSGMRFVKEEVRFFLAVFQERGATRSPATEDSVTEPRKHQNPRQCIPSPSAKPRMHYLAPSTAFSDPSSPRAASLASAACSPALPQRHRRSRHPKYKTRAAPPVARHTMSCANSLERTAYTTSHSHCRYLV